MLPVVLDNLIKRYEQNPVLRGLVQLIPASIGSAIETSVLVKVQNIRQERALIFFDELSNGSQALSPELLQNNEFLHCFFATSNAALRTHRTEKIQHFARLLTASINGKQFSGIDEFEEYMGILDELSAREFSVLCLLDQYEMKHPIQKDENALQRAIRFWPDFIENLSKNYLIAENETDALLTRLNRIGCYETFVGNYLSYTGGKGKITPTFQRLKSIVTPNQQ